MLGAIIGGVLSVGASLLSSKSNKKAINTATEAQTASDAQQVALQREVYGQNQAALSPYMQRGNVAGDHINALLGLGGTVPQQYAAPQAPQPALSVPQYDQYGQYGAGYMDWAQGMMNYNPGGAMPLTAMPGAAYGYSAPAMGTPQVAPQMAPQAPQGGSPQQSALSAYEIFKQSTGYQSRLQEGQRGQGAMYSALGTYQSGARDKALARFNQDYASREFGNYMGMLGNQQGVGFAGASALAGVGQGYADRMGAISQNGADTASQAAIARAQNSGALWQGIAGVAGTTLGALSSYKKPMFA